VRSQARHGSRRKARRTGRHAAPSQAQKVARAAGKAAPAVAVLGALAAVPQIHDLASTGHSGAAGHLTSAPLAAPAAVVNQPANLPATFRTAKYRPWPAATATSGGSAGTRRDAGAHPPAAAHPSAAQPAASPSASATAAGSSGSGAVPHCTGTQGMLPENYAAIVDFLTAHGYTGLAAAGIAGNIYQESKGNPESVGDGGGGLIGWTPLPAGFVTGNVAADLQTQLQALLAYNEGWAQFIPALNAATSATEAADIYMNDFERPGLPAAANREAAAQAVAAACGL